MQSPHLDVAAQRISSPTYITKHSRDGEITDHQFRFFASGDKENESFTQEFFAFGEKLKEHIQNSPFYWKGFGTLRYQSGVLLFEPDEIRLESLQAVAAQRVLRENVQHNMLVGDQEMTSQQVTEALTKVEYKRPWFIIVGWVLFILAVLAVIILLYMKNFQTTSTGLQTKW